MGSSPFARALEAVVRPLEFAVRDGFRHVDRVRELDATVGRSAARASELAIPREARAAFRDVAQAFRDALEPDAREGAVRGALDRLDPYRKPHFAREALARPLSTLPGVGDRRAGQLARRGLASMGDLLFHLPTRYDDRRSLCRVADLEVGRRATFVARVLVADHVPYRTRGKGRFRRAWQAAVEDDSGRINLRWFHVPDALREQVQKGALLLVTGEVRRHRYDLELVHPEVQRLDEAGGEPVDPGQLAAIVPDYPTPEGIPPRTLRGLVSRVVAQHADLVAGHLPASVVRERGLPEVPDALRDVHHPPADLAPEALAARRTPAHERLVLEELFLLETGLAVRHARRAAEPGIALACDGPRVREAPLELPFRLTQAQRRVWGEIQRDLAAPGPMNRLLQGDVGSGKTVIAHLAAVVAAENGTQTALMAPTELLAEQHARSLGRLAAASGAQTPLRIGLLVASLPRAEASAERERVAAGEVDLVVGTHALVQGDVRFASLGLAVIDEQHRFGVVQRQALASKARDARTPNVLVMTATPIPRTLALTVYGDLDVSVIDELPPGRRPVATDVLREGEGPRIVDLIRRTAARGEQIYVVYPLVEESEKVDLRDASESARRIQAAFPDLCVDIVHGRLSADERAAAMRRFERGESQILVSTTVIEVGVDVPAATLMVVEHAERFGLAQLHQLRGRVGRGRRPGTCLLVARGSTEESEARLAAMLRTQDGFEIAEEDLRIRGPGEFLGTRQSGRVADLRVADLVRDARWISVAREAASETVRRDAQLRRRPELAEAVEARWGERLSLSHVG